MKQDELFMEPFIPDFSEFDSIEKTHKFSKQYQIQKKKMLKQYRKTHITSSKIRCIKAASVVFAFIIASPFAVNAATEGELFNRIWGNAGKTTIESHDELLLSNDKDKYCVASYPKREYIETDVKKAEELIGKNISYNQIVKEIGDTTITIYSAISDGNCAVVEYTLEREDGVNILNYSQLDNEAKGAWFKEDSPFYYHYADAGSFIFVDLEKSTDDKLYCYDYICSYNKLSSLTLEIHQQNGNIQKIPVPLNKNVSAYTYVNQNEGIATISPISMAIDMTTGLGLSGDTAYDPINVYYVAIQYKDGTEYLVLEHSDYNYLEDGTKEIVHQADVETENTGYILGRSNGELSLVFNRIVDINMIKSIKINNETYTIK